MLPEYVNEEKLTRFIKEAFQEDSGNGDHSTLSSIPSTALKKASIITKSPGIISGVYLAKRIFQYIDPQCQIEIIKNDGHPVNAQDTVMTLYGYARKILTAERLALNCMQRMSGIASYTYSMNKMIAHTTAKLIDTRKTTPNFRMLEKWAVKTGGGENHRFGLFDMIILKDNHIDYAGGISKAIDSAKDYLKSNQLNLKIEVETRTLNEVKEVLNKGGVDRILLDNMNIDMLKEAVYMINQQTESEASGNIDENNIAEIASSGVDYISSGALTHSYKCLDLSLKAHI